MYIKCKPFFLLFLLLSLSSFAQEYSEEFHNYKQEYPDASFVRLNNEVNLTLEVKNGKIEIEQENIEEDLYLTESAKYGSKRSLEFSSFFELSDIEASSFQYNSNKYEEFKVENFTEKDELENSFHDDAKSINYIYPNLKKGSKSKLKYLETIKDPRFLSPFYFANFSPVIQNKLTITADNEIDLEFKEFNTQDFDIVFTKEEKRNKTIYSWELKNVEPFKYESKSTSLKKVLPHIVPRIKSYQINDNKINILTSVDDLYHWYYSLVKDLNEEEPTQEMISLVNDLTKDKTSDLEKVKAIYYWVQQNIKYIAFEYELGGFIPREANKVYANKYGDCKDNSSILKQMLDIAGLKGQLTWIGTRSIPYTYEEMPTPMADNHMILSYIDKGKTYYLDATGRYLPIDFPSSFIQGKEALVSFGEDHFEIKQVPVVEAKRNLFRDSTLLKVHKDFLGGEASATISGYHKNILFQYLENTKTEDDVKEMYKTVLEKGNNKFLITDYKNTNKFSYDKNFIVDYHFKIQDYAKFLGDEIYLNLNLNKYLSYAKPEKDRENELEYDFKNQLEFTTVLEIPEGYVVDYIPQNEIVESDLLTASITYKQQENSIIYKHEITLNFIELTLEEQKEVIKLIDKMEKAYNEIIVLKKKA
ncbi:transglutaminase-like domain-containing protein [Mesonia mobilis]|uniref:transglutaminase-like domain-containing protein n=1 Tax=Mesonia mobilis TaxID=369791 RepID=UPI0024BA350D|nr:transglutaminase-like domain-containing protein [Mesonia mobilis]